MSKVVFYTGYGSDPWGPSTLLTSGLGGTETAVIGLAEQYAIAGHEVYVTGTGVNTEQCNGVSYLPWDETHLKRLTSGAIDTVIGVGYLHSSLVFDKFHVGEHVLWIHNEEPYTWLRGSSMSEAEIDLAVSRIHSVWVPSMQALCYVKQRFTKLSNTPTIIVPNALNDGILPVDLRMKFENIQEHGFKIIYTSCVTRGLMELLNVWTAIKVAYPLAELHISYPAYSAKMEGASDILMVATSDWYRSRGVTVHGSLSKPALYELMSQSHFWVYPTTYDETFCITAIEMIAHGVAILTSDSGNLSSFADFSLVKQIDHTDITPRNVFYKFADLYDKIVNDFTESMIRLDGFSSEIIDYHTWKRAYEVSSSSLKQLYATSSECFFDTIYIITDDTKACNSQTIPADAVQRVRSLGVRDKNTKFVIVPAVDGRAITSDILKQYNLSLYPLWKIEDSSNSWWNRDMTPGEIGCAIAHMAVWHHINVTGANRALILESDFTPVKPLHVVDYSSLPMDWDLLYLGRNLLPGYEDTDVGLSDFVKPGPSYNLHAYALSAKGAKNLMDYNFGNKIMPVDEFIPATYGPHPRADLDFIWRDVQAYAVAYDLIVQTNNKNTTITGLSGDVNVKSVHDTLMMYQYSREKAYTNNVIQQDVQPSAPIEPTLFSYFNDKDGWLRKYVHRAVIQKEWELIGDMPIPGVFSFDMFTQAFCDDIIAEAEKQNKWTVARHEFYPTTDFVLDAIGLGETYKELIQEFIVPAAKYYYGLEGTGWKRPTSEDFMARYTPDTQSLLALHHDFSDVTALINLSDPSDYTGGGTYFQLYKATHVGKKGQLTLHPGRISHRHGGRPILSGKRYILVSFINSTK